MKSIFDFKHVKNVSAWALLDNDGKIAGRVIAHYSDNPSGSVCSLAVIFYSPELYFGGKHEDYEGRFNGAVIGKAGGYGYDKFSAAFADCIQKNGLECKDVSGRGKTQVHAWLQIHGLDYYSII